MTPGCDALRFIICLLTGRRFDTVSLVDSTALAASSPPLQAAGSAFPHRRRSSITTDFVHTGDCFVAGVNRKKDRLRPRQWQYATTAHLQAVGVPAGPVCPFWQTVDDAVREFVPMAYQRRPLRWFQRSWDVAVPGRSVLKVHRDGSWKLVHAVGAIQATSKSVDVGVPNKDGYAIRLCLFRYLN